MRTGLLTILACQVSDLAGVSARAADLDAYGGFTDVRGEQIRCFHTQKIDDRWWLVTPEGHGFFGIGLNHPVTSFSQGAVTFAYNGDQEAWLRDGIRKMRNLGYNCVWGGPYSTSAKRTRSSRWSRRRVCPRCSAIRSSATFIRNHWSAIPGLPARSPIILIDECCITFSLAADPDFIGVSFCACLFDNSHWFQPYDRGQPGLYTIDNEPRSKTIESVKQANTSIL